MRGENGALGFRKGDAEALFFPDPIEKILSSVMWAIDSGRLSPYNGPLTPKKKEVMEGEEKYLEEVQSFGKREVLEN